MRNTDENRKIFNDKNNNDKQSPYAKNKKRITIGNDVYIGANVFINASKVSNIGDGAIIGSCSCTGRCTAICNRSRRTRQNKKIPLSAGNDKNPAPNQMVELVSRRNKRKR